MSEPERHLRVVPGEWPAHTKARGDDPGTAKGAAARTVPRQGRQRYRILEQLVELGGLTYEELADTTGILVVSVSTRLKELEVDGWAYVDGERITSAGSPARIWHATGRAVAFIEDGGLEW